MKLGRQRHFPTMPGGGVGFVAPYENILIDTYGATEVWPLVDISSGTTISASVNPARSGMLAGWDLKNVAGPRPGTLAPLLGAGDSGSILSANGSTGLADIFDPVAGWMSICIKPDTAALTDGLRHYAMYLFVDGSNYISIYKQNTNNLMTYTFSSGGVSVTTNGTKSDTEWSQVVMTWDKNAGATGEVKMYLDGSLIVTKTGITGTWSGSLTTNTGIGARTIAANDYWLGCLAYAAVGFGSALKPEEVVNMHNDLFSLVSVPLALALTINGPKDYEVIQR